MNVEIHPDLQAIMMLYSLPSSFENFRCAIESRDELPDPESLRIKIIEEGEARKADNRGNGTPNAMTAQCKSKPSKNVKNYGNTSEKPPFKFKCHRCRKFGHKAADCKQRTDQSNPNQNANYSLMTSTEESALADSAVSKIM